MCFVLYLKLLPSSSTTLLRVLTFSPVLSLCGSSSGIITGPTVTEVGGRLCCEHFVLHVKCDMSPRCSHAMVRGPGERTDYGAVVRSAVRR